MIDKRRITYWRSGCVAALFVLTLATGKPSEAQGNRGPNPQSSTELQRRIAVYDQAIEDLRQELASIEKSEKESNLNAYWGVSGLYWSKAVKAVADSTISIAGNLSGPEAEALKNGYDALSKSLEGLQTHPLGKPDDPGWVSRVGDATKQATELLDRLGNDLPNDPILTAIKSVGDATKGIGTIADARYQFRSLNSEQQSFVQQVDQARDRIRVAITSLEQRRDDTLSAISKGDSRSLPSTLKQTPEGLVYNPPALTPSERAARKINEQKMADEILKMRGSASGASQVDQVITLKSWLDGGDRSLSPSDLKQFYDQYPQLRKYASVATYSSPESEVQDDLNSGALKLTPATPSEQAARQVNEGKMAAETLNNSPLPAALKQTPEGLVYNPAALTPSEQAARRINEQKMADEILKMQSFASGASQLDQAVTLKSWLDGGDRSLSPSELQNFYDQYPQLRKYASVAAYRSPESEVQDDLKSGALKLTPATPSEQAAQKINEQKMAAETLINPPLPTTLKQTPEGLVYNPAALTPSEQAARQANEQKMAAEILKMRGPGSRPLQLDQTTTLKSWLDGGDRSLSPSELKQFYDEYPQLRQYASIAAHGSPESEVQGDLNSGALKLTPATPSEQAAQKINEQKMAAETLNNPPLPATLKQTPEGLIYNPAALTPSEQAARQANEQKMAAETLKNSSLLGPELFPGSQKGDILDNISGTDSFGYGTSTRQSADGRLTAVSQLSFRNAGGEWPQSIVKWAVYDRGQFVGVYDNDVGLSENGKFQVLIKPGAMGTMTPDGKPTAPVYATYDAGLEIQKQQFVLANSASLRNSGYVDEQAFGGGVFAGFKVGHGWDLLDSHGQNLGDGVFQQVKPLVGGAFAVSTDSFGRQWEIFDASGHRLGDGTYADVEVQNGQIDAWKQLGGSAVSLMPSSSNSASVPVQQSPTHAVSTNSVNSAVRSQAVSSLSASQGESILQRARQRKQDLQSQQQNLLQHLQNLDQQVREASQVQGSTQQVAPIPSSGTRNPLIPTTECLANKSAMHCGVASRSPQSATLARPAVAQHTPVSSGGANHIPPSSKPTAPPPAPPHLPPPAVPPKVIVAPIKTK